MLNHCLSQKGRTLVDKSQPAQLEKARRLLAHEGATGRAGQRAQPVAGRVYDKLHGCLAPLVGEAGAQLLFLRSARLSQGAFAWLGEAPVGQSSQRLREFLHAQKPAVATEAAAALFGNVLTLMTVFIGARLTSQLLRGAWPTFEESVPRENSK